MASVQDVFAQMQAEQTEVLADETFTPDSNEYCVLESDATRRILIPQKYAVFGVESDDKTNRIKFAFPKAVNDIQDLSQYNIRFNYIDAKGNTDQITARNMQVQGDYVLFDWILTRNVTRYQGNISFIVCAVTVKEDGVISNEWNTTVATAQSLEGIETEPTPGEEQIARDLLTELLVSLNNSKNDAVAEITQTKTQAISDVQAEGQTQTNAVDAKGAQVLESIPDDYTTLENRVDELEQNRAYVIVGNGSGEFVTLNDSSELKTRNIKLFGKSVQAETTGIQLFDINTAKNYDEAEITDYSSGTMVIDQSNSAMLQSPKLKEWCPTMQVGQSYLLTCETTSTKKYITIGSSQWNFGGIFIPTADDLEENVEWHCTTQRSTSDDIVYYRDTFAGIMIVEGSSKKPYEVYTGGEAATEPTPEFPLPITSAGNYDAESEKYEVGIAVTGAQLFDASKLPTKTQGGATVTNNGDGSFTVSGSGALSETYLNQYNYSNDDSKKILKKGILSIGNVDAVFPYFRFVIRRSDSTSIALLSSESGDKSSIEITDEIINLIFTENAYVSIDFYGFGGDIKSGTVKPMVYQSENGVWEPFKQQLTTLQLPNPLRGIPVDSGGNYTDETGQQWICDYIDRERGKYVQCVKEVVFDGSDDEKWSAYMANPGFYIQKLDVYTQWQGKRNSPGICNIFSVDDYLNAGIPGVWIGYDTIRYIYVHNANPTYAKSVEEWREFLQSHNMVVIYPISYPIETDLTSDQIAALNLSTYQGITNIGTDTMSQVGIDVEYIADTKTYIDNAIAEAIAAIPTE